MLEQNLEAAEAQISQAREALAYTTITSPIDGVVTRINAEVGELVKNTIRHKAFVRVLAKKYAQYDLAMRVP